MPIIRANAGIITQINVFTVPKGGQQENDDKITKGVLLPLSYGSNFTSMQAVYIGRNHLLKGIQDKLDRFVLNGLTLDEVLDKGVVDFGK
jgi:hypothetical protein